MQKNVKFTNSDIEIAKDVKICYKDEIGRKICGIVQNVTTEYLTVCIRPGEHPSHDVCVLIYLSDWNQLIPMQKIN